MRMDRTVKAAKEEGYAAEDLLGTQAQRSVQEVVQANEASFVKAARVARVCTKRRQQQWQSIGKVDALEQESKLR